MKSGSNHGNLGRKHSPETREKVRQATLRRWADPECRERMCQAMLGHQNGRGRYVPPETREKHRQVMLGRKASPETREKIRQAATKQMASPEAREKMRQAALRYWADPEHRAAQSQRRLQQTLPTKMTSIERLLHDEFKKRRLHFEMHKTMFGHFQPDFVFAGAYLIVQADGDYWHSRPDRKANDAAFNKLAHDAGWSVWRFGEKEIEMHAAACARAVARFVRDHR